MKNDKPAVLFDLDGVIIDTESQYTRFWDKVSAKFYPDIRHFGLEIKGKTLIEIYETYFPDPAVQAQLSEALDYFEKHMAYEYISGAFDFLTAIRRQGMKIALVTSSNDAKLNILYERHPELKAMFDAEVTAEKVTRSKPDPECFRLGAELLQADPADCFVFEDSLAGLTAARASGATVIGLATTYPAKMIEELCDHIIPDFTGFTPEAMLNVFPRLAL
ncbi:MAG: HAD family phosphatase [Coprobacter sp.]|nr:HAD family phosphatase [Coprobacter sp.]